MFWSGEDTVGQAREHLLPCVEPTGQGVTDPCERCSTERWDAAQVTESWNPNSKAGKRTTNGKEEGGTCGQRVKFSDI